MRPMTIEELDVLLNSKEFQDVENGDLFYNFYLFQYEAAKEYDVRRQIRQFENSLIRPTNYIDVLSIDLFEEFCTFLDGQRFLSHPSYLKYLLEKEKVDPDAVDRTLRSKANSEAFWLYVHNLIMNHINKSDSNKRPYIFLYGMGKMYPYLRTNVFLTNYEPYNKTDKYKIIVFYPGHTENNNFKLFDRLDDVHTYRATLLLND